MIDWENYRLHRGTIEISDLHARKSDREYWLSRPPVERFAHLEFLRQLNYGYDPATARLQRILEIVPLKPR
jgi:hypothetical protein